MFSILFILLLVVVLVAVMGPMARHRSWSYERDGARPLHKRAFEILNQRLAKGEIDRSEYDDKRRTIAEGW